MENRFCLQMVSCGDGCCGGNSALENVYSTEETVCGKWIDGKPIYRKVIIGKLAAESGNGHVFANVSDLKIDQVINLYGNTVGKKIADNIMLQTSYNRTNGLSTAINMFCNTDSGDINYNFIDVGGGLLESTANVIIEYTKK